MGQITFSGLASGMDTSSWIEALVSIKQQSVTTLQNKQMTLEKSKSVLDTVKSSVSNLRSSIEKITDAKFGGSFDIFAKNAVTSSNDAVVTATATTDAARQSLDIVVDRLATATTATSTFNAKINRDTIFNKLSSGNAKEGKFSVFADGKKSEINIGKDETLGSIIDKLNAIDGINASITDGKLSIAPDDGEDIVVGSSTDESNFASVLGLVNQPFGYINKSGISLSGISGRLSNQFGSKVVGSFAVSIDGVETTVNIGNYDTLSQVRTKLSNIGIDTSFDDDGKLILDGHGKDIELGSESDTSNFVSIVGGFTKEEKNYEYISYNSVNAFDVSQKLSDVFGESVVGTFTIGNQEFTVDENTTLKSLIGNINSKSDSGVTAYWDAAAGSLILKSKTDGAFNINIEAGSSNLTDKLGFTRQVYNGEGGYTSSLVQSAQKLGDYAKLNINGTDIISSSNTVTSDISGIDGLTLTLKAVSKEKEEGVKESTNISITQDVDNLVNTMKSFIDSYNKAIETIDSKTAKNEALYGDTSLTSIRNNLRRTATTSAENTDLKVLANIGISTGAATNTTDTSGVNKLQLDEKKFKKALEENPEAVKQLLLGDNKGTENSGGILNKLEKITEDALATNSGYFDSKSKSYSSQVETIKRSVSNAQLKVDAYQQRLQKQFNAMENAIAKMQQNYSKFNI